MNKLLQKIFKYLPLFLKQWVVGVLLKKDAAEIKIAETKEELEQVYHLRWEVYSAEDYIEPEDYPDQRLTDKYDQHAASFLALTSNIHLLADFRCLRFTQQGLTLP